MAAKTSWHRYKTKLRHCHPVYNEERTNKKLSYRRGTARRVVPVETVRNVAKMFVQLHLTFTTTSSTLYTKKHSRINRILRTYTLLHGSLETAYCPRRPFTTLIGFYRAMRCIRGTSHGPVSVCVCLSG